MSAPTHACALCHAPLVVEEPRGRFVDARSGDVGGTYDYCPGRSDAERAADLGHVAVRLSHVRLVELIDVETGTGSTWHEYGHMTPGGFVRVVLMPAVTLHRSASQVQTWARNDLAEVSA